MSEMKNIAVVLSEIETCRNSLNALYAELKSLFESQSPQLDLIPQVAEEKSFTKDEVRSILAEKAKAGYAFTFKMLIAKYGGCTLSDVKPEDYADLVNDAHVYCREISKEEVVESSDFIEKHESKEYLKGLLEHHYATSVDDLKPEYYDSFLWDTGRVYVGK